MRRLDIYWLWFGDDYDAVIIGNIREFEPDYFETDDRIFYETDLIEMTRSLMSDIAIEVLTNEPARGYTEEHYDAWIRLENIALTYCYSMLANLSSEIIDSLKYKFDIARNEMYGYYI